MITADQLLAHLVGDYVLQSHWMATQKVKKSIPALIHALLYTIPFLFFHPSVVAWVVMFSTHFVIDRFRAARYIVWTKNLLAPRATWTEWKRSGGTGYDETVPVWLSVWLTIIVDNALHIAINGAALKYL
jgi:hypothetical protein